MFQPPAFSNAANIITAALTTSNGINAIKNNLESFANSIDQYTDTVVTSSTTLTKLSLVTLIDASGGNVTVTLPSIATYRGSGLVAPCFKRLDKTTNTVTIQAAGTEYLEDVRANALIPVADSQTSTNNLTLDLINQAVHLYPTSGYGWRLLNHYLPINQASCRVATTASQAFTANIYSTINFTNKTGTNLYDRNNNFNTTTGEYTAPTTGVYQLSLTQAWESPGSSIFQQTVLQYNTGSGYANYLILGEDQTASSAIYYRYTYSPTIYLKKNWKIKAIAVVQSNINLVGGSDTTTFAIHLLSL